MEYYSSSYSSSNKSSYISQNTKKVNGSMKHDPHPFQSKYSWLHSVRKSPVKKLRNAPMVPKPTKIYKVDPINFKQLVQSLTCEPESIPSKPDSHNLLQNTDHTIALDIVPSLPMNNLSTRVNNTIEAVSSTNNWYQYFEAEYFGKSSEDDEVMTPGLLEMNLLSPTTFGNWCFVPAMMSPTV